MGIDLRHRHRFASETEVLEWKLIMALYCMAVNGNLMSLLLNNSFCSTSPAHTVTLPLTQRADLSNNCTDCDQLNDITNY